MNAEAALLRKVPLFSAIPERQLEALARLAKHRNFEAGERLMSQGEPGVGLYFIVSGLVRIEKKAEDGTLVETATQGAGSFVGEISVIDGASRTADVTAAEPTECLVLASWEFKAFVESNPSVALSVLPVLVSRFRELNAALTGAS